MMITARDFENALNNLSEETYGLPYEQLSERKKNLLQGKLRSLADKGFKVPTTNQKGIHL